MHDWHTVLLGDVAEKITVGFVGTMASQYVHQGIPFLRSLNVKPLRIDLSDVRYVAPEFNARISKSELHPGDVVTVRTGSPGATAVIPPTLPVANCSDLVITRPGPLLDPRWLSYYINGAAGGFVESRLVGAVQQHFNIASARELELVLPPLATQRAIAATLGALDDKIDSNRRAVTLLNSLVMALFDRVSQVKGVEMVQLADLVTVTKGVSYRRDDLRESRTALVTLKSVGRTGDYRPDGLKAFAGRYRPEQEVRPGEIVVAQTDLTQAADVVGSGVRVPAAHQADVLVASLDLAIVRPLTGRLTLEYLLGVVSDEAFREHCRRRTSGTTVLHLASDAITSYEAPLAPAAAQRHFSQTVRPLIKRADSLNAESIRLAALREYLDPAVLALLSNACVRIVTFAPHITQIFQILDLTLFGVFKRREQ